MTQRRSHFYSFWLLVAVVAAPGTAHGQAEREAAEPSDTTTAIAVDPVTVVGRIDNLIGIARSASEGRVGAIDLRSRPITREGELLETVPGMIVTQHSGEGKANQYFVRGFNLDHGTDFRTHVEGMPVNMPTHGHGQGYTDLNFIIPELVDFLDYRLGVYHAGLGDFGSAGGAELHLARTLERPFIAASIGEYGSRRLVGAGSARIVDGDLLAGIEGRAHDGPWEQPDEVRKLNGLVRYSRESGDSRVSFLGMVYRNEWNANDQVPRRAVDDGIIDRFGQVDPTDAGESRRYSLSGSWSRLGRNFAQEVQLYGIYSDLDLYSNFTYFLEDPVDGDQFQQRDRRTIFGLNARHAHEVTAMGAAHSLTVGLQARTDVIDGLGLYRTRERVRHGTIRDDEVRQTSAGLFLEAVSRWRPWFRGILGVRADGYTFDVESDLAANSGDRRAGIVSPKASLVFSPSPTAELYVSGGFGFHSNDARGVIIVIDPTTGEAVERVDPLVRSRGAEVGIRAAPVEGLRSTLTAWALDLDSELVFVGDAGGTEPSAASERRGITWANFYRPMPALAFDADISLSRARLADTSADENRIPGALETVFAAGVAWTPSAGPFAALRVRHFGEYPLVEDNSVRADAATLLNGEVGYLLTSGVRLEAAILNLLDADASDIQYVYASRLPGEPAAGVEDVHFHPVEPRQVRVSLEWQF